MSLVPSGWLATKLQEIVKLRTGPFGSSLHKSDYVENGIPVINPMHIIDGEIRATLKHCVSKETAERLHEFKLRIGDVVLGRRGEMGRCAVVKEKQSGWLCGTGSLVVTGAKGISPSFLRWMLSSDDVIRRLTTESVGSTMVNLNQQILLDLDVVVPPTVEQTRIVEKLEELFSDLDAGVAELKAAQAKLVRYRQSLLKAAVEGALTAEWRQHNTPEETGAQLLQRILSERRTRWEDKQLAKFAEQGKAPHKDWQKKYPEPVQPDTRDLPVLPEGWVWASVEQLGHVQLGRQRSPSKLGKADPTPYIRAANIREDGVDLSDVLEMDFSDAEKKTFALKVGDVLLTEASGSPEHVGRPAIWKHTEKLYCFQNTVLRFTPAGVSSEYAFYSFLAMQKLGVFSKLSGGVGINHLSAGKFSRLPVPLPSIVEQDALVETIENKFSLCNEQAKSNDLSLSQSTAQRKNILSAAFSGQLVPQNPNDEPASALLARIRAERAERDKQPKVRKPKQHKEITAVASNLKEVLAEAGDWVSAQEAFRRCGVADGAQTEQLEVLYAELRALDKAGLLAVEPVIDRKGRKLHDRLKLLAT